MIYATIIRVIYNNIW